MPQAPNQDLLKPALQPDSYAALLPLVWSLMVQPPDLPLSRRASAVSDTSVATAVGVAFIEHLLRTGHDSVTRRLGIQFLARMCLVSSELLSEVSLVDPSAQKIHDLDQPKLPFSIPTSSPIRPLLQSWLKSFPRCLWELSNQDPNTTSTLLRFVLHISQKGTSLFDQQVLTELQGQMSAYFHVNHQTRGSILGPWSRLSSTDLRCLAVDTMFAISKSTSSEEGLKEVSHAMELAGAAESAHWQALILIR